jgi:hypothetical protein
MLLSGKKTTNSADGDDKGRMLILRTSAWRISPITRSVKE